MRRLLRGSRANRRAKPSTRLPAKGVPPVEARPLRKGGPDRPLLLCSLQDVNDYDDEPQYVSAAQRSNQALIEDPDDAYLGNGRQGGGQGGLIQPQRELQPLLSAPDEDTAWSLGMPKLQESLDAKKASKARGIFNQTMAGRSRAQQTVPKMFGEKTAADYSRGPGGLLKEGADKGFWMKRLFGRKAGNFRAKERQEYKDLGFFGRLKRAGGRDPDKENRSLRERMFGPKRSWMQRLFGAKKKNPKNSTDTELSESEKSAFSAQGSGSSWADALAPVNARGAAIYDDGSVGVSPQMGVGRQSADQDDDQRSDVAVDEEEKSEVADRPQFGNRNFNDSNLDIEEEEKVDMTNPLALANFNAQFAGNSGMFSPEEDRKLDEEIEADDNNDDNEGMSDEDRTNFHNFIMGIMPHRESI